MLSLAKKKLDKIFINANAGTPYPKNFNATAVISTSFSKNDPYLSSPVLHAIPTQRKLLHHSDIQVGKL